MESEVNNLLIAAHELKAPVAVLRQLAFSLDYAEDKAEQEKIRNEMISVSDRAIRQLNDLTRMSHLEDGLFQMEPVSIRALCDDVVKELAYLFRYNNKNLHIKYKNTSRLVVANRDLLFSIIYNFCLNAMHYSTEETGSEILVKNRGKSTVRFAVRDYGPALPVDIWRELKRGFVSRPTSIAMRPGSSGLGLYIASKFSRFMHCEVGAIRHRDGTSFFVDIPVSNQISLFSE